MESPLLPHHVEMNLLLPVIFPTQPSLSQVVLILFQEGVNHMTDWTDEEYKQMLGYDKKYGYSRHQPIFTEVCDTTVPA